VVTKLEEMQDSCQAEFGLYLLVDRLKCLAMDKFRELTLNQRAGENEKDEITNLKKQVAQYQLTLSNMQGR
jgi:hypothetical protein